MFTAFCDFLGATYRDDDVPRAVHTLVQPYLGLIVELVDAPDGDRAALDVRLASDHVARVVSGPVAVTLRFEPRPLPADKLAHVRQLEGVERIVTLLHFLEADRSDCWDRFATSAERLGGSLAMQAAFIPTKHGTNAYTDELFSSSSIADGADSLITRQGAS